MKSDFPTHQKKLNRKIKISAGIYIYIQGRRNSIISGEAPQVKERTRAGNFKKLL